MENLRFLERSKLSTSIFLIRNSFFFILFISLSLEGQNETKFSPEILMPNPTAASLGKYIDSPVDKSTGIPDITIPLCEVKDGGLRLPISLKYHLGGLKVAETSSDIGMGWSLHTGGMISRVVKGFPDEFPGGYIDNFAGINSNASFLYADKDYLEGKEDLEPDVFTFSAGGYSGKFFYSDKGWTTATIQNIKIESKLEDSTSKNKMIESFKITTPDGQKYFFGRFDYSDGLETTKPSGPSLAGGYFTYTNSSTWYLVRIESSDDNNQINFEYTDNFYVVVSKNYPHYHRDKIEIDNGGGFLVNCNNHLYSEGEDARYTEDVTKIYEGRKLFRITSSTDIIEFVRDTEHREDIKSDFVEDEKKQAPESPSYAIDYIEIKNGSFCKKYDLEQSYFVDPDFSNEYNGKRLKLQSITELSCPNNSNNTNSIPRIEKPSFIFKYVGDPEGLSGRATFAPNRFSQRIDHWGFFNDAGINDPLAVLAPFTKVGDIEYGDAIRETNPEAVKVASLKKNHLPNRRVHNLRCRE